jgi:general secretion pathway protein G
MPRNIRRHRASCARGGFTLIELLLVMVIIAVLAAVVVPKFVGRSEQARITRAKADISILGLSLNSMEIDTGRYPTTLEGLVTAPATNADEWHGPYIERGVPSDPWKRPYIYRYPGQHNTNGFDLYSVGPDGQEGGGDDIDNWSTE